MTVNDCVNDAAGVLVAAGFASDEARRDASVLARHALGWTLVQWAAGSRETASDKLSVRLMAFAHRRATHEPVAYITGVREFYGRDFAVTPAVLIPRPETEALVEDVLRALETGTGTTGSPTIVDVGTGSGCIAITLALERPTARVIATDVSAAALDVARANARALGATGVVFQQTSLVPADVRSIDVIVSNPPYIPEGDRASLPVDVRDFEPAVALFSRGDGLDVIGRLVAAARTALSPGGWLIMEIGVNQAAVVSDIVRQSGLRLEHIRADLQGIPRVVVASFR
jgi:release factor glutamine methyltransferase